MTEKGISRRTLVKGAAWSVPVIAVAVSTPLAAASTAPVCERFHHYDPKNYGPYDSMGPQYNVATITVTATAVVIKYIRETDIQDINIRKTSGSQNLHVDGRVNVGREIIIPLVDCEDPSFIQVHGNNAHYYGGGVFR